MITIQGENCIGNIDSQILFKGNIRSGNNGIKSGHFVERIRIASIFFFLHVLLVQKIGIKIIKR